MKDAIGIFLLRWRIRTLLPLLKGRVLDVGCGTNQLLAAYKASTLKSNSLGIDVVQWGEVDLVVQDTTALPFDDASFDTVVCAAALNHIPERKEFLHEANRVLRPNGRFVATMIPPNLSRIWHFVRSPWDADQHERGMQEGEVYGFTKSEMRTLISGSGLHLRQEYSFMLGINTAYTAEKP